MKQYNKNRILATAACPSLPLTCLVLLTLMIFPHAEAALAAKGTVGGTTGSAGRMGHPSTGVQSDLEILKRRYYLAQEENRFEVLEEIRSLATQEALGFTVELLRYPDIKVRREAVDSLKRWGQAGYEAVFSGTMDKEISWLCESIFVELGSRGVPYLLEQLDQADPVLRGQAAFLLGRLKDPLTVGPLYKHLKDPDRGVRIQVIQALCELGDEESLEQILDLFETQDVGLADFVLQAAERFGPRAAAPLQAALRSSSVRIRSGAALALGRLRLPETLPFLVGALGDRDAAVRRSVVKALDSFHHVSAAEGLFRAMKDPDLEVQDYATSALARLAPGIYPSVMERLSDLDPQVRKNAVVCLRKIGDKRAVPEIMRALDDPDVNVRMFAVTALIELKDPRAIGGLIARMKREKELGWLISYAFLEMGEMAAGELLKTEGDDSFCLTRNLVILQMGDDALDILHGQATRAGTATVRFNAIALLGELGRPESVPVLVGLLDDRETGWVAANALADMGSVAWGPLQERAVSGGVAGENSCRAIARMKDPDLYADLVEALGSDNRDLRKAVSEPLVRAGEDAVMMVLGKMRELEGDRFSNAAEILCRISDKGAIHELEKALFPEPWEPALLDPDQLYQLRQSYARKGSLQPILARLQDEINGAGGGGGPWERIAH